MLDQLSDYEFLDYEDGVYYAVGEKIRSDDKARRKSTDEQILRSLGKTFLLFMKPLDHTGQ